MKGIKLTLYFLLMGLIPALTVFIIDISIILCLNLLFSEITVMMNLIVIILMNIGGILSGAMIGKTLNKPIQKILKL